MKFGLKGKFGLTGAVASLVMGTPAAAQDDAGPPAGSGSTITAAISGGTLGIGPELGVRLSDHIGIRGSATFLGFGRSFDSDDIEYDGRLKLKSYGAMIDVYPFGGSFRLSGGARINRNRVTASATPSEVTTIGDNEYTPTEIGTIRGDADFKKFSPAATLGWGGGNSRGFLFGVDIGVLFQGAPKLRASATGTASGTAAFRADLEQERQSLQDDIDVVKVYPILQIAIGYRF